MLAAGMGKRLGPYTEHTTKCMVKVNDKTLIEYCIEALLEVNITNLVMVIGYKGDVLQDFLKDKYPSMSITWIENPVYNKTNNIYSLYLAASALEQDDTILLESDLIFDSSILSELLENKEKNLAVVSPFESWMDGTVTLLDKNNNITGMLGKSNFDWENKKQYYKTVNIYKFSKEFSHQYYIPFLEAYQKAYGQNEYYEQVLKVISFLNSSTLKALQVSGDRWYEIDDIQDLTIASNRFAKDDDKLTLMQNRYGGYWRFPNMLDYCYLVNPYFPTKNLVKELKANFKTLLTEYPSGANEQSMLAGKMFAIKSEKIVVGNGAAELISALTEYIKPPFAIPYPTFNEYPERFIKQYGKDCIQKIHSNPINFRYDASTIKNAVIEAEKNGTMPSTVLLINPDNPSGNFIGEKDAIDLISFLKEKDILCIFDESFIDFSESSVRYTLFNDSLLEEYPNLIVIKSISKSYGVPGLRLGVLACGDEQLIKMLKKEVSIWNINSFGEYFMQIIGKYKKDYAIGCDKIVEERTRFIKELRLINGLEVFDSEANYVLCKLTSPLPSSASLTKELLANHNIFIKDLSSKESFENGQYIRLAVRSKEDNDSILAALKKY